MKGQAWQGETIGHHVRTYIARHPDELLEHLEVTSNHPVPFNAARKGKKKKMTNQVS